MSRLTLLTCCLALLGALCPAHAAADKPLNVLFLCSDDMRPDLGCYGHPSVKSPNFDRLAASGTLFLRAYCQQSVCNATRSSLLTGFRPDTIRIYDNAINFREHRPDAVTLPQIFQQHGYFTEHVGKVFHGDDPKSWSRNKNYPAAPRRGPEGEKVIAELQAAKKAGTYTQERIRGLPWEAPEVGDRDLADGTTVDAIIKILNEVKDKPFFVACGFANPHLPFVAPKKYWDMYPASSIKLADNPYPPHYAPAYAPTQWGELRAYVGMPKEGPLTDEQALQAKHGYWAAISYVDAQLGRLLDEVDRLGLRENTIIIFWGDHGWQLGEHGCWSKQTNYETSARAPLMISVPHQARRGAKCNQLVEFVDIYPTLCDLCGLPRSAELEGNSFRPLIENPDRAWKEAVFHQYPRTTPEHGAGMGHAIRTDRYRMVEWKFEQDGFTEYELYDLQIDPDENVSVAADPHYADVLKDLQGQLAAGWQAQRPGK